MVDQIQNRISEISEKVSLLVQGISALKLENQNLENALLKKEQELIELKAKHNDELSSSIEVTKQKVTESGSKNLEKRNQEIDVLVKEIEICIDELKK